MAKLTREVEAQLRKKAKLSKVEKNQIKLANKLSASFRKAFPHASAELKKKWAPIRVSDIEHREYARLRREYKKR